MKKCVWNREKIKNNQKLSKKYQKGDFSCSTIIGVWVNRKRMEMQYCLKAGHKPNILNLVCMDLECP